MIYKYTNDNLPIVFMGDHHGAWRSLLYTIERRNLSNCLLISVGDCGIGFEPEDYTIELVTKLNNKFKQRNIYFKAIRGNHDNPSYFKKGRIIELSNFELLEDYSIIKNNGAVIQLIGGAISTDRTGRKEGTSYWQDEGIVFNEELCKEVDILVTHTAPSYCFPQGFNEIVHRWAEQDKTLLDELTAERGIMDKILNICRPKLHLYGHFHSSYNEEIFGCRHRLLGIEEMFELKTSL